MPCGFGQSICFVIYSWCLTNLIYVVDIKNRAKHAGCILKCDKMFADTFESIWNECRVFWATLYTRKLLLIVWHSKQEKGNKHLSL